MNDLIDDLNGRDVPGADADAAAKTEAILQARRFDPAVKPPEGRAIFTLNGITIATPGNLCAFYAQVKAGKTAALGAMQASIMLPENSEADCFGFKSSNPKGLAVLSFDTEQSKADFWRNVKRTLNRAGLDAPPPWFRPYFFAGLDLGQLLKCIEMEIELAQKECGGIHSFFLDGAGDCVPSVNDEVQSNAFVARLHGLAIEHDCVGVPALHFNPVAAAKGAIAKARGHLGSQLERKAETNFQLDKDATTQITEIWSSKNRKAGIPKGKGPCFQWSDEAGMHISVTTNGARKGEKKAQELRCQLVDAFEGKLSLRYTDLKVYLMEQLKLKETTAENRIDKATDLGVIEKTANRYTLKT